MDIRLLPFLCCPVTRSSFQLRTIAGSENTPGHRGKAIISEGILFAAEDWFYPITGGIPRLNVEAFLDHEEFFRLHLADYLQRKQLLEQKYPGLIAAVKRK